MDPVTQQARDLLSQRLKTIESEARSVQTALNALDRGNGNGKSTARRRPARQSVKGGKRPAQALRLIKANPGIKIPELAKKMKLKNPNYLYRIIPDLPVEKDGDGRLTVKSEPQAA